MSGWGGEGLKEFRMFFQCKFNLKILKRNCCGFVSDKPKRVINSNVCPTKYFEAKITGEGEEGEE